MNGPWSNIQHAIFDKYLIDRLPAEQAKIIKTAGPAVRAAYSRLFTPVQRELLGEVPTTSASRATMENVFAAWEKMGPDIVHGGSRSQRVWTGEGGRYESMFKSDFDMYSKDVRNANAAYHRVVEEVSTEFPRVEEMRGTHPATSRDITKVQASITTNPKDDFVHIKPFDAYQYMRESPPVKVEAIGENMGYGVDPRLLFKRSVAGMFSEITQKTSGVPELVIDRPKDIAGAYSMSRSYAETLYRPPFVDVAGVFTKAKVSRAAALEEYSMAIRDYARTSLSKADAAEVGSMFKEMRKDWLKGVERNPSPTIDLVTGRGIMEKMDVESAVLFPGRSNRSSFAKESTPPSIESMFKEINKRSIESEYPTSRAAEKYPAGFAPRTRNVYPVAQYPTRNYPAGYVGKSGYPSAAKYPGGKNYPTGGKYPGADYPPNKYPSGATIDFTVTDYPRGGGYDNGGIDFTVTDYPRGGNTDYPPGFQSYNRFKLPFTTTTTRRYPPPPSITYLPKKKQYGKKGKARRASEWYIWNPTPGFGSVFGQGISMPWISAKEIISTQFRYPGPGKTRKIPAYFSERPRF